MFDTLTDRLGIAFKRFTDKGRLTPEDVDAGLREVRLALLEADVNYKVARDFIDRIRERALGSDVLGSLTPGQQVIKVVHEELVGLLGGEDAKITYHPEPPTTVMLMGLQGSGKTTSAVKLARLVAQEGHRPILVAADLQRAAAVEQLRILASEQKVDVLECALDQGLARGVRQAVAEARRRGADVVIVDTAGRIQLDQALMEELQAVTKATRIHHRLLVVDAMTGQEAVKVAQAFQAAVGVDGVVLTKLDGDARGGAALSMRAAIGIQVWYCGVGERARDLEPFHPERMARRILGMGDVLTLVERASQEISAADAKQVEERIRAGRITLDDFVTQMRQLRRLGPLESIIGMMPGGRELMRQGGAIPDETQLGRIEAIVLSMTAQERRRPALIDASRRRRIAAGSGTSAVEVSRLIKGFERMQEMMRGLSGGGGRRRLAAELWKGGAGALQGPGEPG
ncbi:MAG TPA: signal recognition particle protein [Candidatus Dormibacteraeota bacterium]|nr:signal recognition particle protein [Candidatus Dormibacteraeota bacterium]